MTSLEASLMIDMRDIIAHKLDLIPRNLESLSKQVNDGFARGFYKLLNDVTEQTGKVVTFTDGDVEAALKEMIEQVPYGVDRYGHPTRPSFHVGTDFFEKIKHLLDKGSQTASEEIEALDHPKEMAAVRDEANRISKFRRKI
jgi:hypothetical protein